MARSHLQEVFHDGFNVLAKNLLLLISQVLDVSNGLGELVFGKRITKVGNPLSKGVSAGVFAQDQSGLGYADVLGPHDLISAGLS